MHLAFLTATLTCALSLGARASTEIQATNGEAEKALAEAVATCPIALTDLFKRTQSRHHRVLRARFALDADGELVAQVLLRVISTDLVSFHEWTGRVYSGGWVPRQRVLTGKSELTEAERLWALRPGSGILWQAVHKAGQAKAADQTDDIVLSAVASSRGGLETVDLLVEREGRTHGLVFDRSTRKFTPANVATPDRVPVDAYSLPSLKVPDGQWFNSDDPITLDTLRGNPVLVLVTNPG